MQLSLRLSTLAAGFLCCLFPIMLIAQQEDIFMNSATLDELLNTPITTASQRQEKLSEAPATVFVLKSSEIAARGYTSLDQLLEDLPEVEIQYKSESISYNWINIRGASGNEHFLILLDGIRINSPVGDKMAIVGNYNIAQIERVEVIVGPGSALWGADAYGGVVNIISKQPEATGEQRLVRGKIQAGYGNFNTLDANGFVQFHRRHLTATVTGGYTGSNEPELPKFYPADFRWYLDSFSVGKGLKTFGPNAPVPFQEWETPAQAAYVHIKANWKGLELGIFRNGEMHNSSISNFSDYSLFVKEAFLGTKIQMGYAKYTFKTKNEKLSGLVQGAYTHYSLNPESKFMNIFTAYNKAWKGSSQKDLSARVQFNYMLSKNHLLVGGATLQRTRILALTSDLDTLYGAIPDSLQYYQGTTIPQDFYIFDQSNAGAFAQYQALLFNKIRLTAGVRFDMNSRYGETFNPRVGLIYAPENSPFTAKLLYGEAFRAPSPQETYQHYGGFPSNTPGDTAFQWRLPNPSLEPEQIRVGEINTAYRFDQFAIEANVYYQRLSNVIDDQLSATNELFKGFVVENVLRPVNERSLSAYGGTAGLKYVGKISEATVNFWFYYSYADGSSDIKNYLMYMPKHSIKSGLSLSYQRFSISPRMLLRGKTYGVAATADGEPLTTAPRYLLLNLNARYHIWGENEQGLSLFITARNLLDKRYYHPGIALGDTSMPLVPQDPIRIMGGLSFSF